jgi:hypothetical protein
VALKELVTLELKGVLGQVPFLTPLHRQVAVAVARATVTAQHKMVLQADRVAVRATSPGLLVRWAQVTHQQQARLKATAAA